LADGQGPKRGGELMDRVINWAIIGNPANWLIVFFVLYLVSLIAKVLYEATQGQTAISLPQGL
jgi:hypothetical protein